MLYQITSLLLEVAAGLIAGMCLLRLYMQYQRIPMSARAGNPMGNFIFALTDWLVLPLRKVLPAMGRWDTASLVGAFLVQLVRFALLWAMNGFAGGALSLLVYAVFGLVYLCLYGLTGMVIVYAVLSWVQTQSAVSDLMERLVMPVLIPIRRVLPLVGGVDLSPLVLLVLLQILGIVLGSAQTAALMLL
ncbi:YggT family protein [Rhodoferax saidenbachensis]|uniref:YggT family protein n=1 Tax=Rhodoferax saidenbachensis TaxID=1484693 RepID=A0A1P8K863_9BURK|nr:YggT family protein [Rhodoferax saidenbachensis]APW42179.1 YggT family protein [Rhodoferax saidenbachensis]